MGALEAHDPKVLSQYEGLIFSTSRLYGAFIDDDFEDIQQILRVKVFKALLAYDPSKDPVPRANARGTARDRWVYRCIENAAKDLLKKKPRNESFIEDFTEPSSDAQPTRRDWFENMVGLVSTHDEVYGAIEDDDLVMPNTLSQLERRVICLLYDGYRQSEVARSLGLVKRDMERLMRSIRAKMEDWRPTTEVVLVLVADRPAERLAA